MKEFNIENHEPSLLPEGDWELVWSDEFDGDMLDTTKWDYRRSMMGKEWLSWTDKGVRLEGSDAVFELMLSEDGRPVCSQLQTGYNFMDQPVVKTKFGADSLQWNIGKLHENKFTHRYGYYECRCKLQQKEGWWSAFWVQSPINGATLDPATSGTELDIMESFKPGEVAGHNAFTGGCGPDLKRRCVGGKKGLDTSVYHRFGLLWDETGYTFYVDGKEDGRITDFVSHIPEFILISTEVMGYRRESRQPDSEAFDAIGDTFRVDYVRVFDRK